MSDALHIAQVASPVPDADWRRLADADDYLVAYQSADWFKSICAATGGIDISRMYTMADGRQMVLPLVQNKFTRGQLSVAGSPPKSWGMGGLIADQPIQPSDITAIVEDLKSLNFMRISIRPNPLLGDVWKQGMPADVYASRRFAHVVDLEPGYDWLYRKGFAHAVRKGIKKSNRNGVEIICESGTRLLPVYQKMFEDSIERWAEQQREPVAMARYRANRRDPFSKLEAIANGMGDKCKTWVAMHEGKPASALITIEEGRCVSGVKAAMDKTIAGPLQTNDLIYSHVIEQACEKGFLYYHLGESGDNPGLDKFKRRFGAVGHDYAEYFIERLPLSETDAKARTAVKKLIGFKDF